MIGKRKSITYVRCQHNGCFFLRRHCHHPYMPSVWPSRVGDVRDDLPRESLRAIWIHNAERNAVFRVCRDGKVPPVPPILAAVQRVFGLRVIGVLVGGDTVRLAVQGEGCILDAVGVTPRNGTVVGVQLVLGVKGRVVPTEDDVSLFAVGVADEEVGDGCLDGEV